MLLPIFEDNHLLILNKPAGLLTQPSGTEQQSLEEQAKAWIKAVYHKPGNVFLGAVHRLDKPVSGVVLFGKTSKALSRLNATMRAKQTRKIYWAWIEGSLGPDEGKLEHFLVHDDFSSRVVDATHPDGKFASLSYKVLKREKKATLVEIELDTGRYHQIRVQFAALGHPVRGDRKYGSHQEHLPGAIALHHRALHFFHPINQDLMIFEAPLPFDFYSGAGI
ncbi:MAG: RluA family pseudouridine synthase [Parachlamydiaceae bacterium]